MSSLNTPRLSRLLARMDRSSEESGPKPSLQRLQLKMLRTQQGVWHAKRRLIILFEGFDAAGKGGAIRRLTEKIDPRGVHVVPVGAPTDDDRRRHYLFRFWRELPQPGNITIFDRSWYGRVLVEKVDGLASGARIAQAYKEINQFEAMLQSDGIELIKIFLGITKEEQLRRFRSRLKDPYKQWKLSEADIVARAKWEDYVTAADQMFKATHTRSAPWHLVPANNKHMARHTVLSIVTKTLEHHTQWIEEHAAHPKRADALEKMLR
jgi:polyphosphate kinase 2 (PPK2 family)